MRLDKITKTKIQQVESKDITIDIVMVEREEQVWSFSSLFLEIFSSISCQMYQGWMRRPSVKMMIHPCLLLPELSDLADQPRRVSLRLH